MDKNRKGHGVIEGSEKDFLFPSNCLKPKSPKPNTITKTHFFKNSIFLDVPIYQPMKSTRYQVFAKALLAILLVSGGVLCTKNSFAQSTIVG